MVAEAVKGNLLRRSSCEACGSQSNVDGHHDDYSQPLSVRWLCRSHHLMTHRTPGFKIGGGNDAPTFDMSRLGMLCPGSRYDSRRKRRADGSYVSDAEKAVDCIERKNRQRKRSRNRKRTEQRSRKRAEKRNEIFGARDIGELPSECNTSEKRRLDRQKRRHSKARLKHKFRVEIARQELANLTNRGRVKKVKKPCTQKERVKRIIKIVRLESIIAGLSPCEIEVNVQQARKAQSQLQKVNMSKRAIKRNKKRAKKKADTSAKFG